MPQSCAAVGALFVVLRSGGGAGGLLRLLYTAVVVGAACAVGLGWHASVVGADRGLILPPLRIAVMDPLSKHLACDCVAGYAQRDYERLKGFLAKRLGRAIEVCYAETLVSPHVPAIAEIDLVVGKYSEVLADATASVLPVRTIAMLSGKDGQITQTGLFVVRTDDAAQAIPQLKGHRLLFGLDDAQEKRSAAFAALEAFGIAVSAAAPSVASCSTAALAVAEKDADGAVISSYAMPLLEGCGTVDKGALRIVGKTDPVPFIGVFATSRVDGQLEASLVAALNAVRTDASLLAALESRDGFVRLPELFANEGHAAAEWPDWRGPQRDALSPDVPKSLPAEPKLLWSRILTGSGMSGLAVSRGRIVVADKNLDGDHDIFRCLDADTGEQKWMLSYPAQGEMDFTNSPRANPVIRDGFVYLLGAFGDLHCVQLHSGRTAWKRNLAKDFGADVPTWGYCSTPLIVDSKLIVNPGAAAASLVALDCLTGKTIWTAPGDPPGYASFALAELGGARQIVGYEAASAGGWDPTTGQRLWQLVPELGGDFNVATPIVTDGKLLLSTENNGTRLYAFADNGRIVPQPIAKSEDLMPHTSTPVACEGHVFGSDGRLVCLNLNDKLATLWSTDDDPFADYCSFIAGNGRVLVVTQSGSLCLLDATQKSLRIVSRVDLFRDVAAADRDVWSHAALLGNRLYIRNSLAVCCFLID